MFVWVGAGLMLSGGLVLQRARRLEDEGDPERGDRTRVWAYALLLAASALVLVIAVAGSQSLVLKIAEGVPAIGLLAILGREIYRLAP
ncbi:hypothetical protein ACWELJ_25820 [Nocardia sp. NPDC004582]